MIPSPLGAVGGLGRGKVPRTVARRCWERGQARSGHGKRGPAPYETGGADVGVGADGAGGGQLDDALHRSLFAGAVAARLWPGTEKSDTTSRAEILYQRQ